MTFAWFTDTASTGVNKIEAGTLKVAIVDETGGTILNNTINFVNKEKDSNILWEPGVTFKTTEFKVKNNGNLALKYKLAIDTSSVRGDSKLLEVIDFSVVGEDGNAVDLNTLEGKLETAGATSEKYYIKAHMDEAAGNDYQNLSLEGIKIKVYATQLNHESDSNGKDYDANATYPVSSVAGMKTALTNGGIVEVAGDLDTGKETLKVTNNTTINMNGNKIENTENVWIDNDGSDGNWSLISARSGANLTISGNGTFKAKENDAMAVDVQGGATLTIKNGTFIGNVDAVYVETGTAIIEGGFFDIQQKAYGNTIKAQYRFLLNCYDANYRNGTAKIIVKGGTFVNFDPSDNPEGAGTTFVADGYKVTSETKANGDIWYTVVPE